MKSLTLAAAIIVIAALFVVPTLRERQTDERFEGRPFPALRPDHAFQAAELQPAVGGSSPPQAEDRPVASLPIMPSLVALESAISPVPQATMPSVLTQTEGIGSTDELDLDALTDSLEQQLDFSPILEAPSPGEFGLQFDDEKLTSKNDFQPFATKHMAGDTPSQILRGQQVDDSMQFAADREPETPSSDYFARPEPVDERPVEDRDGVRANPFDAPIVELSSSPTDSPSLGRDQLARIYLGQAKQYPSDQSSRVAFNPFTSAARQQRPIARPRFEQTQTSVDIDSLAVPTDSEANLDALVNESRSVSLTTPDPLESNTSELLSVQPSPVAAEHVSVSREPTLAEKQAGEVGSGVPVPALIHPDDEPILAEPSPIAGFKSVAEPAEVMPPTFTPAPKVAMPEQNADSTYVPSAATQLQAPANHFISGSAPVHTHAGAPASCPCGCTDRGLANDWSICHDQSAISVGGWLSAGYHSASNNLFNSRPDELALHQGWLFAERKATDDSPIGFRVDAMYGIDANDTQAFGNPAGTYDFLNGFDYGAYGWAFPQAYVELALGEWNLRAGHFFTLLGYEVVGAPDNFFYSHAMTMYNSEPFTHTGVIVNRKFGDLDVFAGWTLGWDTGFEQFGDGNSWLGGFNYALNDCASLAYYSTAGNFGRRGDDGYSQSVVLDLTLTEKLNYVVQSDYLQVASTGEDNVGLNQYLLYSLSDKVSLGSRVEWWKGDVLTGYAPHGAILPVAGSLSYYAATFGVNIRPTETFVLRPEVRHDWSPAANYEETYFGIDAVWSF